VVRLCKSMKLLAVRLKYRIQVFEK
jgi:hypothetical protein